MELKFVLESILFSAQRPLSPKEMKDLLAAAVEHDEGGVALSFKKTPIDAIEQNLAELATDHEQAQRSYRLACIGGFWQFVSQPEYAPWIKALVGQKSRPPRLSQPALETLAIIAYRQPLTRAEIEQVRGVAVDGVIATLLERGLIEQAGRAEVIGRPMTYATTPLFLEYFGLRSLEDLPASDELRRIPVQKPEALLTVEQGDSSAATPETSSQSADQGQPTPDSASHMAEAQSAGSLESEPEAPSADPAQDPQQSSGPNTTQTSS